MVNRVQIGTELVPGNGAIAGAFNLEHPLGGNVLQFPLGDGIRRDSESLGQSQLRPEMPKNTIKGGGAGSVAHISDGIHRQLIQRNQQCIAQPDTANDNAEMADTPKPEHYPTFALWLEATRKAFNVNKAKIAEIADVEPQAVTKWFKGGDVKPASLAKIANWSGADYSELRMLLEGQPIKKTRIKGAPLPPSPAMRRVTAKLRSLEHDENCMHLIESLADTLLAQQSAHHKRKSP